MDLDEMLKAMSEEKANQFRAKWDELKREEERKRDANYDPVLRWKHIQETITWAEQNLPLHLQRSRPANRIAEERRKNARRTSN